MIIKLSEKLSLCVALSPAGQGPTLSDGVAPHVETHADDGAGQEDCEHHQGADQQVEEGVEDGAAGKVGQETKRIKTVQSLLNVSIHSSHFWEM